MAPASNVLELPTTGSKDSGSAPALITPGPYGAVYVRHAGCFIFRTAKLRADFRLLEHPEIVLSRWYRAADFRGGRVRAPHHSDLVRELSAVLGQRVRHDRIPLSLLQGIYVRAEVRTVTSDRRQHELAEINQYSIIERLIGRLDP
jgi:hypothetical protein